MKRVLIDKRLAQASKLSRVPNVELSVMILQSQKDSGISERINGDVLYNATVEAVRHNWDKRVLTPAGHSLLRYLEANHA